MHRIKHAKRWNSRKSLIPSALTRTRYSAPECPWNCSNITRDRRLYNSISCNCFCVIPHLDLTDHSSDTRPSSGIQFWNMNIILWKRHNHHAVPHEYLLYPFIKPGKRSVHFGMMSCEPEQTRLYHSVQWSTQEELSWSLARPRQHFIPPNYGLLGSAARKDGSKSDSNVRIVGRRRSWADQRICWLREECRVWHGAADTSHGEMKCVAIRLRFDTE